MFGGSERRDEPEVTLQAKTEISGIFREDVEEVPVAVASPF